MFAKFVFYIFAVDIFFSNNYGKYWLSLQDDYILLTMFVGVPELAQGEPNYLSTKRQSTKSKKKAVDVNIIFFFCRTCQFLQHPILFGSKNLNQVLAILLYSYYNKLIVNIYNLKASKFLLLNLNILL